MRRMVVPLAAAALVACSSGDESSDMTPAEAQAEVQEDLVPLVEDLAGRGVQITGPEEVPCGGLGGNELTKVKYDYDVGGGPSATPPQALADDASSRLEALGVEVTNRGPVDDRVDLDIRSDAYTGTLQLFDDGGVVLLVETTCLDNPDL